MSIFVRSFLALAAATAILFAASVNPVKGNEGKGKYFFKQTCKDCHVKGAQAGEVTPLTRTMAQWHTYFLKGKHAGGTEPLTKFMTPEQLRDVETFLFNHAVDSLQPETCGK